MVYARSKAQRLKNGTRYDLVIRVVGSYSMSAFLKTTD